MTPVVSACKPYVQFHLKFPGCFMRESHNVPKQYNHVCMPNIQIEGNTLRRLLGHLHIQFTRF